MIRLAVFLAMLTGPATAQVCLPPQHVEEILTANGEEMVAIGLISVKELVQVWANIETGAWTVVTRDARGWSCMTMASKDFALDFSFDPKGPNL